MVTPPARRTESGTRRSTGSGYRGSCEHCETLVFDGEMEPPPRRATKH